MCVRACVCVCVYVGMYICMYMYMYVCTVPVLLLHLTMYSCRVTRVAQ